MYAQFFGNYLLSKQAVTTEQLIQAIEEQHIKHLKLGTLAIHAGLMNIEQVEHVLERQTCEDKRFGELAIEEGYLTKQQLDDLLSQQVPVYLTIGQRLVENGALTDTQLEEYILSYQKENSLQTDTVSLHQEQLDSLIQNLFLITFADIPKYLIKYLSLLFNNLIRFIGDDFILLHPVLCREYLTSHCSTQTIDGEAPLTAYLDIPDEAVLPFAKRYAKENFQEINEYVKASIDDFLNIHNGLFTVNISNEDSIELVLDPPSSLTNSLISSTRNYIHLQIVYPFGTLNFLIQI